MPHPGRILDTQLDFAALSPPALGLQGIAGINGD
jgi:hypothetical protein